MYAYPEIDSARQAIGHYIPVPVLPKVSFETISPFGTAYAVERSYLIHELEWSSHWMQAELALVWTISAQWYHPASRACLTRPAQKTRACLDLFRAHSGRFRRPILRDRARFWSFCLMSHEIRRGRGGQCFALYIVYKDGPAAVAKLSSR